MHLLYFQLSRIHSRTKSCFTGQRRSHRKIAVVLKEVSVMFSKQRKNVCIDEEGASKQGFTHLHMHPWPRQRATMCVLGLFSVSSFWSRITVSSSSRNATNNDDDNSFWSSLTRNSRIQRAPYCWSARRRSIYFGSSAGGTVYDDLCACAICVRLSPDITARYRLWTNACYLSSIFYYITKWNAGDVRMFKWVNKWSTAAFDAFDSCVTVSNLNKLIYCTNETNENFNRIDVLHARIFIVWKKYEYWLFRVAHIFSCAWAKRLLSQDNLYRMRIETGMQKKERYFNRELEKRHIKARFTIFHRLTIFLLFFFHLKMWF